MTEAEALSSLTEMAETSLAFISVWISVTFAYLTVSYLVGKDPSRFQYLAVTALYVVVALQMTMAGVTWITAWEELHAREVTVLRDVYIANFAYADTAMVFFLLGTVLALYFMYNIRRSSDN